MKNMVPLLKKHATALPAAPKSDAGGSRRPVTPKSDEGGSAAEADPGPAGQSRPVAAGIHREANVRPCRRAGLPSPADKIYARADTLNHQHAKNRPIRHSLVTPELGEGGSFIIRDGALFQGNNANNANNANNDINTSFRLTRPAARSIKVNPTQSNRCPSIHESNNPPIRFRFLAFSLSAFQRATPRKPA